MRPAHTLMHTMFFNSSAVGCLQAASSRDWERTQFSSMGRSLRLSSSPVTLSSFRGDNSLVRPNDLVLLWYSLTLRRTCGERMS